MKTQDFYFDLPESLIARYPPAERGKSRLMLLDARKGKISHRMAEELPEILAGPELRGKALAGSEDGNGSGLPPLLVFNNSRVRKARLPGRSLATGAPADFLLIRRLDSHSWSVLVEKAKRKKPGSRYLFSGGLEGEIIEWTDKGGTGRNDKTFRCLRFDSPVGDEWLDLYGHVPLPPYIKRGDDSADVERYQTVYADRAAGAELDPGASAAAPTAGLHWTRELLERLEASGIELVFITLHVGLGTFLPLRTECIEDHVMHEEAYCIGGEAVRRINGARAEGRKIIAVGTTSARALESAWRGEDGSASRGAVQPGEGQTSLFIYPGYCFKAVDALFTNFHTPGSTLLLLAAAFAGQLRGEPEAGRGLILESYAVAVREGYRFFSYGDAMLIY